MSERKFNKKKPLSPVIRPVAALRRLDGVPSIATPQHDIKSNFYAPETGAAA
jgi:hypothetical protein